MRLAPKLILVVTLPIAAVVAVHAWWSVRHVTERLRVEYGDQLAVQVDALAAAAEEAARRGGGWDAARRLVERVARE